MKARIGSRDICSPEGTRRDRHIACTPAEWISNLTIGQTEQLTMRSASTNVPLRPRTPNDDGEKLFLIVINATAFSIDISVLLAIAVRNAFGWRRWSARLQAEKCQCILA